MKTTETLLLLGLTLTWTHDVAARHYPDQGEAYLGCLEAGRRFTSRPSAPWSKNAKCTFIPHIGGNSGYLCTADNIVAQTTGNQCNVGDIVATHTFSANKTCSARPVNSDDVSVPAGTLSCDVGCELASLGDSLRQPTGGVCQAPPPVVEPGKGNCCDVMGGR